MCILQNKVLINGDLCNTADVKLKVTRVNRSTDMNSIKTINLGFFVLLKLKR